MFRTKALAKLQSPEKLDEPQRLMRRNTREATITLLTLPILCLVWSVCGAVPEEGRGQGILLTPGAIKPVQAPASGQIIRWFVREGDVVKAGQVLGLVEQIRVEQEIRHGRDKLAELEARNKIVGDLRSQYSDSRRKSIDNRREILQKQITYVEDYVARTAKLAGQTNRRNTQSLRTQKINLKASKSGAKEVEQALRKRLESYIRLNREKLVSDDQLRDIRRDHEDALIKIGEVTLRIQEMSLREVELKESFLGTEAMLTKRENDLTRLRLQLRELDNQLAQLNKSESAAKFRETNQLKNVKRNIDRSKKHLEFNREIKTDYAGRILELSAIEGQFLSQGHRVAQIDTRSETDVLEAVAFFLPKDGKRLAPGSRIRITPSTVDRQKFGGIVAVVKTVSDYPVTQDAVAALVGNRVVARRLTTGGHTIEVRASLITNSDTPSGFQWTSALGPPNSPTAGTYSEAWATVEYRLPISYVLPKLKGLFGF